MRRLIVAALLAIVAGLSASDPLVCPDGCTNDGQHATQPGACAICQNGIVVVEVPDPISAPTLSVSEPQAIPLAVIRPPAHAIEHPPRTTA